MWFKILQIVQAILSFILEAEILTPVGDGTEKKERVMKSAAAELRRTGIIGAEGEAEGEKALVATSAVVDGVVGLLNHTGAFRHAVTPRETPRSSDLYSDAGFVASAQIPAPGLNLDPSSTASVEEDETGSKTPDATEPSE